MPHHSASLGAIIPRIKMAPSSSRSVQKFSRGILIANCYAMLLQKVGILNNRVERGKFVAFCIGERNNGHNIKKKDWKKTVKGGNNRRKKTIRRRRAGRMTGGTDIEIARSAMTLVIGYMVYGYHKIQESMSPGQEENQPVFEYESEYDAPPPALPPALAPAPPPPPLSVINVNATEIVRHIRDACSELELDTYCKYIPKQQTLFESFQRFLSSDTNTSSTLLMSDKEIFDNMKIEFPEMNFTAISHQADEALKVYRSQTGANNYIYVPFTIILIAVFLITYFAFGVYYEEKSLADESKATRSRSSALSSRRAKQPVFEDLSEVFIFNRNGQINKINLTPITKENVPNLAKKVFKFEGRIIDSIDDIISTYKPNFK